MNFYEELMKIDNRRLFIALRRYVETMKKRDISIYSYQDSFSIYCNYDRFLYKVICYSNKIVINSEESYPTMMMHVKENTDDNVYDIDSLFPIVEIDGKYNFFDWAICKVCFNEWFDDVEPYDTKYMKGTMDSGERGYNRKGGHEFTVYKNGKSEQIGYFPSKNFGIA